MRTNDIIIECDNEGCESKEFFKFHKTEKQITECLKNNGWVVTDYTEFCSDVCEEVKQESCNHSPHKIHDHLDWGECTECGKIFQQEGL